MRDIIEEYAEKRAQMAVAKAEREIVIKLSCKGMSIKHFGDNRGSCKRSGR